MFMNEEADCRTFGVVLREDMVGSHASPVVKIPFLDSAPQKDQDSVGRDTLAGDNLQEEGFLRRCSHGMSLGNAQQESCP
jgi:hypothetical protein